MSVISVSDARTAVRNLTRNRRRAAVGLLTIAFGVIAMVLANGFIHWIFWAMRESTIQSQLGHIQVVRPGFHKAGAADPFAFTLPDAARERQTIEATPGVKIVAPRLSVSGLIGFGDTTVAFVADAVDPEKEAALKLAFGIVDGKDLSGKAAPEAIVGRGLAQNLGVKPGDTVSLLATTSGGGINAVEVKVAGIFITASKAYDDTALRLPIGLAHSLLRTQGAHAWLVLLDETEQTDGFLQQFRTRFPLQKSGLEFVPWYERADFYNKTVTLFLQQMKVFQLIIGIIIVLSISNMLIMNVLERTGEIGTLMAIGFKRAGVLRMFVTESLLLGLVGGSIGVAAGYGLAELISAIGIPMPPPPGMERGYTGEIMATWPILTQAFLIAFVTTVVAGLYPAWKASRLQIVDALRQNV
jgi:putative ABC transport system permease protein